MDKFKMELTWHNCKTCPPSEDFNSWLMITDGRNTNSFVYDVRFGFPVVENRLHKYWWADLARTVRETKEFKELVK